MKFNEQREDSFSHAIRSIVDEQIVNLHTALPGTIQSFNSAEQTATVLLDIDREGGVPYPELSRVPVVFPKGGGYILTFPVEPGDSCLVQFIERDMGPWQVGEGREPQDARKHSLSDAVCLVGLRSIPAAVAEYSSTGAALGTENGVSRVHIEADFGITVESDKPIRIVGEKLRIEASTAELLDQIALVCETLATTQALVSYGSSAGSHPISSQSTFAGIASTIRSMIQQ